MNDKRWSERELRAMWAATEKLAEMARAIPEVSDESVDEWLASTAGFVEAELAYLGVPL